MKGVVRLDLSFNALDGEIPPGLGTMTSLEDLNLERNQLGGAIPRELGNLPNLGRLSLRHTHLTETVPPELGNLPLLEFLHINGNRLWGALPHSLTTLPQLRQLEYLDNSGLCSPDDASFEQWLRLVWSEADEPRICVSESIAPDPGDVAIMTTIYNETGGNNWNDTTNWFSEQSLQFWKGVHINADGRVTELQFDNNNLTGDIPTELSELGALEKLILNEQLTGKIPVTEWFAVPMRAPGAASG